MPLACTTRSASRAALGRQRERDAERGRDRALARFDVDELNLRAGRACREPRDEAADRAGADHGDAIADARPEVPEAVDRGLEVRGEHRARGRHAVGQHVHGARRHDVARLMRIEAEHVPADQRGRAALDDPDVAVAVLHGRRKIAGLKRRAHPLVLARRHGAREHERFGAAADAAVERADHRVSGLGAAQHLGPNLAAAWLRDPKRTCVLGRHLAPNRVPSRGRRHTCNALVNMQACRPHARHLRPDGRHTA